MMRIYISIPITGQDEKKQREKDLLKARHYLDMLIQYEYPEVQDLDSGKLPTF